MSEWVFDPAKAGRYVRDIARDQNSEERMNLERIGDALLAIGGKALPTVPSRDAPLLIVDERNGVAVAIEATAIELIEANGEPHAKVTVPEGFVLLDQETFDALGGAPNPAPNPPPADNAHVAEGAEQFPEPGPLAAALANQPDPAGQATTLGDAYNVKADG